MSRVKFNFIVAHCLEGRLDQLGHIHEPLLRRIGLNGHIPAFGVTHFVNMLFNFFHEIELIELFNDHFPSFKTIQTNEFAWYIVIQAGIFIKNIDEFQVVALTHFPVIGIMGWCDFNTTGSKIFIHIFISENGDFTSNQWQNHMFPNEMLIAFIIGMDRHTSIPQHGLWSGGGHN